MAGHSRRLRPWITPGIRLSGRAARLVVAFGLASIQSISKLPDSSWRAESLCRIRIWTGLNTRTPRKGSDTTSIARLPDCLTRSRESTDCYPGTPRSSRDSPFAYILHILGAVFGVSERVKPLCLLGNNEKNGERGIRTPDRLSPCVDARNMRIS